ncbi:MAG: VWA domain-containing protein [Acidobacteriota bacterium]|nr:VWA domain-containing protein [Acidobacteriota bacterium]
MIKRHWHSRLTTPLLVAVVASLILPEALARRVDFVRSNQEETIRVHTNLIPVAATVVDGQGRAVDDLKSEDFELRVDGERKEIRQIVRSETPVKMAVLFDNSGSLNKNRHFARKAAIGFLRSVLRPKDLAALYAVSSDLELSQPLTNNIDQIMRAVGKMGWPSGGTVLLDGVNHAAAYLRPQQGRRVIVIISDGADTRSVTPFNDTLRAVQAANCQVYAVRTGHSDNANARDLTGEHRLRELTTQTGGTMFSPTGPADLEAAFASIAADLAAQYIVSYYAPEDDEERGRFHPIELRVPMKPEARVRFRKGYYTPGK